MDNRGNLRTVDEFPFTEFEFLKKGARIIFLTIDRLDEFENLVGIRMN